MKELLKRAAKRKEATLVLLFALLCALVSLRAPSYLSGKNVNTIANDSALLVIASLGQFLVILIGGIDLSVASNIALVGMTMSLANVAFPGLPAALLLPGGSAMGAATGAFTGLLVAYGGLPPIIASLGTQCIYRGVVYLVLKGSWVTATKMSPGFLALPNTPILGVSSMVWIAALAAAAVIVFMRYTASGREVYAYGGNKTAALFAGVRSRKVEILAFVASGALAGLASVLWVSRYGVAQSETAAGFDLQTVAACVLGGVSMSGGSGAAIGVAIGALFFGAINNALTVVRLSPFYQMALQGFVILFAIVSNTLIDRRNQMKLAARRSV
ncbi:MAG TPA: ABC transporter permease [Spirochaetales bacterium]|nr:ABC transporter permease [Spirochaetales bacterium]HRY54274.1 ABC transporter permease [Spirochaetia bacterium]HRZ64019.1 ABC transporter permease [Spirochaetia bacterium]